LSPIEWQQWKSIFGSLPIYRKAYFVASFHLNGGLANTSSVQVPYLFPISDLGSDFQHLFLSIAGFNRVDAGRLTPLVYRAFSSPLPFLPTCHRYQMSQL